MGGVNHMIGCRGCVLGIGWEHVSILPGLLPPMLMSTKGSQGWVMIAWSFWSLGVGLGWWVGLGPLGIASWGRVRQAQGRGGAARAGALSGESAGDGRVVKDLGWPHEWVVRSGQNTRYF
eukprot:766634-Hanusia_phi.AAC.3